MNPEKDYKIFNDSVHGCIKLHPLCVNIINTSQFQRLRNIKQLGLCYFVFPGASHNRFEHSIGTCHLAKLMIQNIRQRQPKLEITDKDVLCVQIAGLCHDLGHGPFSHVYEAFRKAVAPDDAWKHEDASQEMFDHLYNENNKVQKGFQQAELSHLDRTFIKELIHPSDELKDNFEETGRGKNKGFLYHIISNTENGLDVDKWDYFARDCHHLGIKNNFDHKRLMMFARVIQHDDGRQVIAYRDKVIEDIYNMFHLRRSLHKTAYQHKAVKCITKMFVDALVDANEYITRIGSDREEKGLFESKNDMKAYSQLTDNIFEEILYSPLTYLNNSRCILKCIIDRELYSFIGEVRARGGTPSIQSIAGDHTELVGQLVICETNLDYGSKNKNPVDNVCFYSKKCPKKIIPIQLDEISHMLPINFSEKFVLVFVKEASFIERAEEAFKIWKEKEREKEEKRKEEEKGKEEEKRKEDEKREEKRKEEEKREENEGEENEGEEK